MATIERLGPDDWREFRRIRLRALADAPTSFGMTVADAEQSTEAHWRARLDQGDPVLAVRGGDGLIAMGAGWHPPEERHRMMVWGMWTAPDARRLYEDRGFVATGEWEPLREGSELRIGLLRRTLGAGRA